MASPHVPAVADHVVVLDQDGHPVDTRPRAGVHDAETPLHLAFSCYLLDGAGRILMTRRALGKRTWPGVWTGSFCGHPRWAEPMPAAIARHAAHELGLAAVDAAPALPDFRYRAVDASGVVENEVCPVFVARTLEPIRPNPDEVMDVAWVAPDELARAVAAAPWAFSPWLVLQVRELSALAGRGAGGLAEEIAAALVA